MYSFLVIGATGAGKTYTVKNDIIPKTKNLLAFDLYGDEYNELETITNIRKYKGGKCRIVLDKKQFETKTDLVNDIIKYMSDSMNNFTFVFEDATTFLDSRRNNIVKDLLIGKRHTKINFVWLFHTISEIPPYIFKASNAVFLHKTEDMETSIISKFGKGSKMHLLYNAVQNRKELRGHIFHKLNSLK